MIYFRKNMNVVFLWPALACGVDVDGRPFIEIGFWFFAVGFGNAPDYKESREAGAAQAREAKLREALLAGRAAQKPS